MGKLDHNLDAYRLAATALERLRTLVRRCLESEHGPGWPSSAIPDDPGRVLAQRRDREHSVKWNPSSATDLLDFAGFVNLHQILATHPRLSEAIARLVPEPQALRVRFLELDTVLNRIAYARPVSESDIELLLGFDERLRQLASELAAASAGAEPLAAVAGPGPAATERRTAVPPDAAEPPSPSRPQPGPVPRVPSPAGEPAVEPREAAAGSHRAAPPEPATARAGAARASGGAAGAAPGGAAAGAPPPDGAAAAAKELEGALRRGDDLAVLRALYQEITSLAEGLWGEAPAARTPAWDTVCESHWYRERFSALRLRVVSDFYDLLRAVGERRAGGGSRTELHDFLKERNFAQVLMDLREFFRPLLAPGRPG